MADIIEFPATAELREQRRAVAKFSRELSAHMRTALEERGAFFYLTPR